MLLFIYLIALIVLELLGTFLSYKFVPGDKVTLSTDSNKNYYAVCEWQNTVIQFNQNGGSGGTTATTGEYNQTLRTIAVPERTGYTFEGYFDEYFNCYYSKY